MWHTFIFLTIPLHAGGPIVDKNMTLSLLSSRDTKTYIVFALSFNVSYGPPSMISCVYGSNIPLFVSKASRGPGVLSREVIRSHYINGSHPDMTSVSITVTQPREPRLYRCTVNVEGRVNIDNSATYNFDNKGSGITTGSITGECV